MKSFILSLAVGALVFAGCRKSDEVQQPTAGKGGSISLRLSVLHHNTPIDTGLVYIKYNAATAPANGKWDDTTRIQKLGTAPAQAIFTNLKPGQYFIAGKGYEATNIPEFYVPREGGQPFVLADTGTVQNRSLYVTEEGGH